LEKREDHLDVELFKCLQIWLSWVFLQGMLFLHDNRILHSHLSLDNILFHWNDDGMYISICDWGFSYRVDSPHTSKFTYGTVEEMNKIKAEWLWMDPTLFTIYEQEKLNIAWE
jgi:serine/threonine protein kinase